MVFEEKISHSNVCAEFKISCPNQCSTQEFPRGQVQKFLNYFIKKGQRREIFFYFIPDTKSFRYSMFKTTNFLPI